MKRYLAVALLLAGLARLTAAEPEKITANPNYARAEFEDFSLEQSGKISRAVGTLMESKQFNSQVLDDQISRQFFTNFVNALDYNHMFFLQDDVDRFHAKYAAKLDDLIRDADASPAFEIYEVFKTRVGERYKQIQSLIDREYEFDKDEHFNPDRHELPWPANAKEAEEMWRLRIKNDYLQGEMNGDTHELTKETITKRYRRTTERLTDFDNEQVAGVFLSSLCNTYDPHSDYMIPSELRNFEIHNVDASLTGIGALLREEDGFCKIVSLTTGGPAERSKELSPNDRIVAVAQGEKGEWIDVIEEKLDRVVQLIRGEIGTKVRLEIIPAKGDGSSRKVVTITRDLIRLEQQLPKARIYQHEVSDEETKRLGVIELPTFHKSTVEDVQALIGRLQEEKIDGLVLDLRRNGGGILQQAVDLVGLFIDRGFVVQVRDNMDRVYRLGDPNPMVAYEGPLVVLVSRMSASASEIVAAALQDHGRALVVGDERTHGKGTVQTLMGIEDWLPPEFEVDPGAIKFTVQKFYRIAGGSTQKQGVEPHISLPSVYDYLEIGEEHLPNALESDRIRPVPYESMNLVEPHLASLTERSVARVQKDQEFDFIAKDIELLKEQLEDSSVSLNKQVRIAEKEKREKRQEARKEARSGRPVDEEKILEIDLKRVEENLPMQSLAEIRRLEQEEAAEQEADSDSEEEESEEESEPERDPHLDETLNILTDYIRMLNGERLTGETIASQAEKR